MILRVIDGPTPRVQTFTHRYVDRIELEAADGTVVVYKPLDTVRGPLLQVQEKRAAEHGRTL